MKKGKEIVKKETELTSAEAPSYLDKFVGEKLQREDNFDNTDVALPRVKLLQALSKEVEDFDAAKPGHFWHTGADLLLGTEFDFVVVSRRKKYLLVAPLEDGQGILARADDFVHWDPPKGTFEVKMKGHKSPITWKLAPTVAESGLDKWGTSNPADPQSPPAATLFYDYLILLVNNLDLGPVVLTLTRSQIKKARKGINDKIVMAMRSTKPKPMQALIFTAKAAKEESQQGAYFNMNFIRNGFAAEKLFNMAYELKDTLSTYIIQDEAKTVHEETSPAESKEY